MAITRDVDSIAGNGNCIPPSMYVDAEAARRLAEARAVVAEVCELTGDDWEREITWKDIAESDDLHEKYELVLRLANECKGVSAVRTNGLLVVAPSGDRQITSGGRRKVRKSFQSNGLDPKYGVMLHNAFGDSIAEIADDVAAAMLRSYAGNGSDFQFTTGTGAEDPDVFKTQNVRLGAKGTQERAQYGNGSKRNYIPLMMTNVDSLEVEEALRQHGIETADVNIERVCFEMAANGLDVSNMRNVLRKRNEIGYIAEEYGIGYDIASAVHESLIAETKGMVDIDVIRKMDLSVKVEALRHDIERRSGKISIAGYATGKGVVVRVSDLPEQPELLNVLGITMGDDDPDSPEYDSRLPEFDAVAPSGRLYRFKQSAE